MNKITLTYIVHLTEEMILPYLVMISAKWHVLGNLLGASHEDLAEIRGEPEECLRKVTHLWLSGFCNVPVSLQSLTDALRSTSICENHLAEVIEQGK